MLKERDIIVHVGRGVGGDFMEMEHVPTGIKRRLDPPLGGIDDQKHYRFEFLRQIEAELTEKGLTQYIDDKQPIVQQAVAPNRSLPPTLKSTSSVRGSED